MGFSRQEYWSGLPFPSPGDLPDPGIEPGSPALQTDSLLSEPHKLSLCPGSARDVNLRSFQVFSKPFCGHAWSLSSFSLCSCFWMSDFLQPMDRTFRKIKGEKDTNFLNYIEFTLNGEREGLATMWGGATQHWPPASLSAPLTRNNNQQSEHRSQYWRMGYFLPSLVPESYV